MNDKSEPTMRIDQALRSLPVFDDIYLGMQASNLEMVDSFLTSLEREMDLESIETDSTPVESALPISAISQLWVFGLYELLRTWRARANEVLDFGEKGEGCDRRELQERIQQKKLELQAAMGIENYQFRPFELAAIDSSFLNRVELAIARVECRVFGRLEALRMNLAKHEVPKSRERALSPGYGRIHFDGSICWQVHLSENEVDIISRRELADACRNLSAKNPLNLLPRQIQKQISNFQNHSYGVKKVRLILDDGSEYPGVFVRYNKEVLCVADHDFIPFDLRTVIKATNEPR